MQVWRPFKTVDEAPLAMIDASTVAKEDLLPNKLDLPGRSGWTYSIAANPNHKCASLPLMLARLVHGDLQRGMQLPVCCDGMQLSQEAAASCLGTHFRLESKRAEAAYLAQVLLPQGPQGEHLRELSSCCLCHDCCGLTCAPCLVQPNQALLFACYDSR